MSRVPVSAGVSCLDHVDGMTMWMARTVSEVTHLGCSPETLNKCQLPSAVGPRRVLEAGGGERAAAPGPVGVPTLQRGAGGGVFPGLESVSLVSSDSLPPTKKFFSGSFCPCLTSLYAAKKCVLNTACVLGRLGQGGGTRPAPGRGAGRQEGAG
uniref:Uncharacterized protein n=1 Tax=Molossus molossus TaxID=27622 RepID=A0A7J8IZJ7_MOLMO|nr:hypothetical protein HJG59_010401 [Molossus molossus]